MNPKEKEYELISNISNELPDVVEIYPTHYKKIALLVVSEIKNAVSEYSADIYLDTAYWNTVIKEINNYYNE